jgi:ATP-binding cassette subfamily B protein
MKNDSLPSVLQSHLAREFPGKEPWISFCSDITSAGSFGEEWLIAVENRLLTLSVDNETPRELRRFTIDEIQEIEAINLVGRGVVEVRTPQGIARAISYSNARAARFFDAAARITAKKEGKPDADSPGADHDEKKCDVCGKPVPKDMDRCPRCVHKGRTFLRILDFSRPYAKLLFLLFIFMILSTGFGLIIPYISKLFIDYILKPNPMTGVFDYAKWLWPAAIGLFVAYTMQLFLGGVQERFSGALGYRTVYDVRTAIYGKLQELSLGFFNKHQTGSLLARVNQDTGELQRFIVDFFPMTLESVFLLVGVGIFLFILSWELTLFILLPVIATVYFLKRIFPRVWNYFHRYYHRRARLSALVNDTISGIRVVKAFGQERAEVGKFDKHSSSYRDAGIDLVKQWSVYHPILHFFIMLGGILVWMIGGKLVFLHKMTIGSVVAYSGYLAMFYRPVMTLTRLIEMVTNSLSAAERVFDVIDTEPEVKDADDAVAMPAIKGAIEFKDVSFGYDKFKPVIKRLGFAVNEYEKIGLVGRSGAGKSTIINLICRLYDVDHGSILIDGIDLKKIRHEDIRRQVGVVLQETFLFNGTIYDNIAYARPEASRDEVIEAAIAANAHEFIVTKPDGYDTDVGERGNNLSGGEKQRIAIARAILRNPAILILDEATSSVDTQTEKKIQDALDTLTKNRTTIAIAHRLSTLRNYHRLLFIEDGSLIEEGTHEQLMEKKGKFYELVTMQQQMSQIIGASEPKEQGPNHEHSGSRHHNF